MLFLQEAFHTVSQRLRLTSADVDDPVDLGLYAGRNDHIRQFFHINKIVEILAAGEREVLFPFLLRLRQLGEDGTAVRLITGNVVGAQPMEFARTVRHGQHQTLPQGIFRNAILALRLTGRAFVDGTFPIAHFMHGSHHAQCLQSAFHQVIQKDHMGRQIPHMGRGIVPEPVLPGKMNTYIRAAHLAVDIPVPAENGNIAEFHPVIQPLEREVRGDNPVPAIQRIFYYVPPDITGCTRHQNRFHGNSSLIFRAALP